jgi:protein-S-isoprenylcysteine O-methyltransferase Ste14
MATEKTPITPVKLIFASIYILIFPALILLLSGNWRWIEGWIFSGWFIALCAATILYLYKHDPALLAERFKQPGSGNQKGWDRYMVYGIALVFILWIIIMPLDGQRFNWSPIFPLWLKILGLMGLLLSSFLFYRSYTDNPYLSALVRIQTERKHQVVSSGVYSRVRHPMYLGGILLFVCTPLLLNSLYGIVIAILFIFLLAARIIGEEKLLTSELEGYSEYRKRVKYRIIPYIW